MKSIKLQQQRQQEFSTEQENNADAEVSSAQYREPSVTYRRRKGSKVFGILSIFLLVLVFTAFLTNPSKADSETLTKTEITSYVKKYISEQETSGIGEEIGKGLGMAFAGIIIDYAIKVDVENYYLFSMFRIYPNTEMKKQLIQTADYQNDETSQPEPIKGVIVFGKIIPLNMPKDMTELQTSWFGK